MPNKILQPSFFKYGPVIAPIRLTVKQKFGQHTLVFLDYQINRSVEYVLPDEGTPVHVLWGISPTGTRDFYGYNNHYESVTNQQGFATTRLVVIGTSKTMNNVTPTNWVGVTRSGVAREIARRHKLRSIIHPHDVVLENWTTGIRTDFQALQTLADETGYRLWVDGATLSFLDPQRLLMTAQRQSIPQFFGMDIRSAKIMGGAGAPSDGGPNTRKVVHGLDYRTNEFFTATQGGTDVPDQILPVTASTYTEAGNILDAAQKISGSYYTANLVLTGNAAVEPGVLIELGPHPTLSDLSGFWSVTEATHTLDRSDFTSRVTAIRYADQTPDILTTSTLWGSPGISSMVVRDGKHWEASLQEQVNV